METSIIVFRIKYLFRISQNFSPDNIRKKSYQ